MIIDVHVHPPSHRDEVPPDERQADTVMRSGPPVSTTNSVADFLEAMEMVDKAIVFASAPAPSNPDFAILHFKWDLFREAARNFIAPFQEP